VKVNGIPLVTEKINHNIIAEEINNNKLSKSNQRITSNNGIKKSENLSPKQKNVTNIQDETENPNYITESNYTNENVNEKQDTTKRKNIKPNNLTLVNSSVINEDTSFTTDISEEKSEIITKDTILSTYTSPTQKDNTIHDTENIKEEYDGSNDNSSSVISFSLSSISNMINKNNNITTEKKKVNISPLRNVNGKTFLQLNSTDNKNSNQNNNNNYNNNNILNSSRNNSIYNNSTRNNGTRNNSTHNNSTRNNSTHNNSTRNNSTHNNSSRNNSINEKKKTKSIYDQLDNELDLMINDSSLVLLNSESNYDEKKDKGKEERKFTESPIHEEKIEKPDNSLKTDNVINSIEQTSIKHNKNTFNTTEHKGKELGKYINALEVAKRKAIKSN